MQVIHTLLIQKFRNVTSECNKIWYSNTIWRDHERLQKCQLNHFERLGYSMKFEKCIDLKIDRIWSIVIILKIVMCLKYFRLCNIILSEKYDNILNNHGQIQHIIMKYNVFFLKRKMYVDIHSFYVTPRYILFRSGSCAKANSSNCLLKKLAVTAVCLSLICWCRGSPRSIDPESGQGQSRRVHIPTPPPLPHTYTPPYPDTPTIHSGTISLSCPLCSDQKARFYCACHIAGHSLTRHCKSPSMPVNSIHPSYDGLMLGQRLRRWPNIKPS